jgi:murein DD-endopeptidase MepM/ murein hydrolase activator NlpD
VSRSILVIAAAVAIVTGTVGAAVPARIIFPVVGQVSYIDDFGAPRSGGPHQGIDIMAVKKTPVVAVEAGRVKYWTISRSAGCMLYLYGLSGTMYEYIHLNNDLTMRNDNRGKCVMGTAYAVRDGAHVAAGQQIGYAGDSGDADGIHPHLHFELHPNGGKAVDAYPSLQAAQKLLFVAKAGTPFVLTLTGAVVSATSDRLAVKVDTSQAWPFGLTLTKLNQTVTVTVPATAVVQQTDPSGTVRMSTVVLASKGQRVVVWTQPSLSSLRAERADDGVLVAGLIQLSG